MIDSIKFVIPPFPNYSPLEQLSEETSEYYDIYLQCMCHHFVRITCPICGSQPATNIRYEIIQSECPICHVTTMISRINNSESLHKCKTCNVDTILHSENKTVCLRCKCNKYISIHCSSCKQIPQDEKRWYRIVCKNCKKINLVTRSGKKCGNCKSLLPDLKVSK